MARTLAAARRDLAARIIDAADRPSTRAALVGGQVPSSVEEAAIEFAGLAGAATELADWRDRAAAFAADHGRPPSVTELAQLAGRPRSSAQRARERLRAVGAWPADPRVADGGHVEVETPDPDFGTG